MLTVWNSDGQRAKNQAGTIGLSVLRRRAIHGVEGLQPSSPNIAERLPVGLCQPARVPLKRIIIDSDGNGLWSR